MKNKKTTGSWKFYKKIMESHGKVMEFHLIFSGGNPGLSVGRKNYK